MRNKNLENTLKGSRWAYTGSIAMKMHANRLGVPFPSNRKIGNINIASNNIMRIYQILPNSWRIKGTPSNRHMMFYTNNGKKLNLFKAGGSLAPSMNRVQYINGIPVMNINSLLNKKRNVMNNYNILRNENKIKVNQNINLLKKLSSINSPKRKRNNNSPKRNNNKNSSRRRLFF